MMPAMLVQECINATGSLWAIKIGTSSLGTGTDRVSFLSLNSTLMSLD